ncbi:MAG: hypothetical protein COS42_09115 [Flavobacteriales bacterium CG03_land_8_20_14_0_80_35_15]|nr:hypothetical protein [Zetaproteobacteria bacterium]OIO09428.1 MAG: hypothetical protein AUJ53_09440 [Flavobacteriaceae bacterium CG1_02_35_72]PIV16607.1 MAG: hypothetical protein COS42_09115 [Flavobacteriales bacterium CG03_land_8_20_14_0_80_35_15]PIX07836.1 MAG: hypothetical protein COZ76_01390 [Flavobacteriales bacterium CG_4_8_14_3_um_filter_35_10]
MNLLKFSFILMALMLCAGCSKNGEIFKDYNCKTSAVQTKQIKDAYLKFSLEVPINWKTELYMDQSTSIFATADTTKQLSETFLIKTSLIPGLLRLNQATSDTIKSELTKNQWHINRIKKGLFKNAEALLITSQKQQSNIKIEGLHLYFSLENEHYFEIEIQCFGDKNSDERFCQAIKVINSLIINE